MSLCPTNGYNLLPKNRIGHCHCKNVLRGTDGTSAWAAVGAGIVDWRGQIAALINQGFHHTLSLEIHWRGAGTAEATTRQSMAGLQEILGEFSSRPTTVPNRPLRKRVPRAFLNC
jgi:L-ribulose-5-phosphate 3-epimerase